MGVIANPTIPNQDCTLSTCSLLQAHYQYLPSLAGNALYLAIFSVILVAQIYLGLRSRAWGFLCGMFGGLVLEIIGYVGRIQMHSNPFTDDPFLMCVHLNPTSTTVSLTAKLQVPSHPHHRPSLPHRLNLPLPRPHRRRCRRRSLQSQTTNLHPPLHDL